MSSTPGRTFADACGMVWMVLIGVILSAWVVFGVLSSERRSRVAEIETAAAFERQKRVEKAVSAPVAEEVVTLSSDPLPPNPPGKG